MHVEAVPDGEIELVCHGAKGEGDLGPVPKRVMDFEEATLDSGDTKFGSIPECDTDSEYLVPDERWGTASEPIEVVLEESCKPLRNPGNTASPCTFFRWLVSLSFRVKPLAPLYLHQGTGHVNLEELSQCFDL